MLWRGRGGVKVADSRGVPRSGRRSVVSLLPWSMF